MRKKILIWGGVALSALLLLAIGGVLWFIYMFSPANMTTRSPNLYLIPSDFQGRVTIHYEIPTAPPLPKDGKYIVYKIPTSGEIVTSSSPPVGTAQDLYYFVDQQGHRTPIDVDLEIIGFTIGSSETYFKNGTVTTNPSVGTFLVQKKK